MSNTLCSVDKKDSRDISLRTQTIETTDIETITQSENLGIVWISVIFTGGLFYRSVGVICIFEIASGFSQADLSQKNDVLTNRADNMFLLAIKLSV